MAGSISAEQFLMADWAKFEPDDNNTVLIRMWESWGSDLGHFRAPADHEDHLGLVFDWLSEAHGIPSNHIYLTERKVRDGQ